MSLEGRSQVYFHTYLFFKYICPSSQFTGEGCRGCINMLLPSALQCIQVNGLRITQIISGLPGGNMIIAVLYPFSHEIEFIYLIGKYIFESVMVIGTPSPATNIFCVLLFVLTGLHIREVYLKLHFICHCLFTNNVNNYD